MSSELEAAAADSVGSFLRRKPKHMLPLGSPCPNCATPLEGAWCHACGQRAEDYHRSITRLGWEAVEGFFELDGRLFRTLPRLAIDPGGLTNDYIHGHRAPQIPPFRLFLVVVVLVFLAGSMGGDNDRKNAGTPEQVAAAKAQADADTAKKLKDAGVSIDADDKGARIDMPGVHIQADGADEPKASVETRKAAKAASGDADKSEAKEVGSRRSGVVIGSDDEEVQKNPFLRWMVERAGVISSNEDAFFNSLQDWGHRLAILLLPMSAGILGLMFAWRRRFFIYDHLIFSMHSLSFLGLLVSVIMLGTALTHNSVFSVLILWAPVHLFLHMRKVYGRGVITTLLRMFVLFIFSCIGASLIMAAVFFLTLNDLSSKVGKTSSDVKPADASAPGKAAREAAAELAADARKSARDAAKAAKPAASKDSN